MVGAIDGTNIRIKAPHEEEWAYVNRKGEHSINVQVKSILHFAGSSGSDSTLRVACNNLKERIINLSVCKLHCFSCRLFVTPNW